MSMEHLEHLGLVFIVLGAIPATAFPFAYAYVARGIWWREPSGRALIVSSTALALLLDLSLLFRVVTLPPYASLVVVLVVVALIAAGAWLKLGALLHEWRQGRRSVPPTP